MYQVDKSVPVTVTWGGVTRTAAIGVSRTHEVFGLMVRPEDTELSIHIYSLGRNWNMQPAEMLASAYRHGGWFGFLATGDDARDIKIDADELRRALMELGLLTKDQNLAIAHELLVTESLEEGENLVDLGLIAPTQEDLTIKTGSLILHNSPDTYLGVTVSDGIRSNWDTAEAHWWRDGVRAGLATARRQITDHIEYLSRGVPE